MYDSSPLRKLIEELNLKNKVKIDKLNINFYDKMLLMKRICVEHMINKFKKFKSFIFMASLLIIQDYNKLLYSLLIGAFKNKIILSPYRMYI